MFRLVSKLKALEKTLRAMNSGYFRNFHVKATTNKQKLQELLEAIQLDPLMRYLLNLKERISRNTMHLYKLRGFS